MQIKDILDSLFEYDTCTDNRYIIPKLPYKFGSSTEYIELLVTNGYVKLYTQKGRAYWISQVQYSEHKSPEWKFHFNVAYKDLRMEYNSNHNSSFKAKLFSSHSGYLWYEGNFNKKQQSMV